MLSRDREPRLRRQDDGIAWSSATVWIIALTTLVTLIQLIGDRFFGLDVHGALQARPAGWAQVYVSMDPPTPVGAPRWAWLSLWRPLTANLVHRYGLFHLLLNMATLALVGPRVEAWLGRARLAVIYAASGYLGWVAGSFLSGGGSGASAAVAGVLAALCVVAVRDTGDAQRVVLPAVLSAIWIGAGFLLQGRRILGLGEVTVATAAHLMGFAVGLLSALVLGRPLPEPDTQAGRLIRRHHWEP